MISSKIAYTLTERERIHKSGGLRHAWFESDDRMNMNHKNKIAITGQHCTRFGICVGRSIRDIPLFEISWG
jgi:hypothetical protein